VARREARIVVTDDLDFGELCVRRALPVPGVILLRYDPVDIPDLPNRVRRAIALRGEALLGHLTVVMPRKLRYRKLAGVAGAASSFGSR
jgi:predicted nuclease of predicted toxin-antitoxin system